MSCLNKSLNFLNQLIVISSPFSILTFGFHCVFFKIFELSHTSLTTSLFGDLVRCGSFLIFALELSFSKIFFAISLIVYSLFDPTFNTLPKKFFIFRISPVTTHISTIIIFFIIYFIIIICVGFIAIL